MRECFQMGLSLGKQSQFQQKSAKLGFKKSQLPVDQRVVPPLKKFNSQPDCSSYDQLASMTKSKIKFINKNSFTKICAKSNFIKHRTVDHIQSSQDTQVREASLTPNPTPTQPQDIQVSQLSAHSLAQAWTPGASQASQASDFPKADSPKKPSIAFKN